MSRRSSNQVVFTSHEYTQKVVPLFSEVTRSKALQAESSVLMEKNQSTLIRLQISEEVCDCSSVSIDSFQSSESRPHVISPPKPINPIDKSAFCRSRIFASSSLSDVNIKNPREFPGRVKRSCSTISPQIVRLRPLRQQIKGPNGSESDDSESLSPEETYAEYLRTRSLPEEPPLPYLSPSLLQATAASLRHQKIKSNPVKEISTTPSSSNPVQRMAATQPRKNCISSPEKSSNSWIRRSSSSATTSPTDAILYKRRHSTGVVSPSPLSSTTGSLSSIASKEPQPSARRQSTSTSKTPFSSSGATSVDSGSSPLEVLFSQSLNRSIKQSLSISVRQASKAERSKGNFKAPVLHEARRGRRFSAKSNDERCLERSAFWRKVLVLTFALKASGQALFQHRNKQGTDREKERLAAKCIMRAFLHRREIRFATLHIREAAVYRISRFFAKVIGMWRQRRAALRVKDFLMVSSSFRRPTQGFCAALVFRFLRAVRVVQGAYRAFSAMKRSQIMSLENVWDACEGNHISHIFQMVQDHYRDCLTTSHVIAVKVPGQSKRRGSTHAADNSPVRTSTQSALRRNSAPGLSPEGRGKVYNNNRNAPHQLQQSQSQSPSPWCRDDGDYHIAPLPKPNFDELNNDRYKSNLLWQEKRWLSIDNKFSSLITNDDKKRTEKEVIATYTLSSGDKLYLLHKIYKDARQKRMDKYDESLLLQQKALEKKDVFTCADAFNFLRSGDEKGLMSMLKHKMQQVQLFIGTTDSRRQCLPFIFYSSVIDDSIVHQCMREAHKEKRTYEHIFEHYSRYR